MGLNAANSIYACLWCDIHRDNRLWYYVYVEVFNSPPFLRWDMSLTMQECKSRSRSLCHLQRCSTLPKSRKDLRLGCVHPPLFQVELDHVIVDELHLLLRISDKLIGNIILRMAQLDQRSRVHHTGQPDNIHKLCEAIRSCGIHFQVSS